MNFAKEVKKASDRIHPYIKETYFDRSFLFSELLGGDVWFKLENHQVTGSFKARGALNKLLSLSDAEKRKGVISASTGNHGAAVAYASSELNVNCTIYVPDNASPAKLSNMKKYGADVNMFGNDCVEAEKKARDISILNGQTYVSPYNDQYVMAGQGSLGVEIASQCDHLDAIIISVGGGGLIGGTASYLKSVWPDIEVIGCSPENSAVMIHSMAAGKILDLDSKPTLSDGTAGGVELDSITFPVCCDVIDDTIMVSEDDIKQAMIMYMGHEHQLIEGAAGTAIAALIKKSESLKGKKVGVVICGGNISLDVVREILG